MMETVEIKAGSKLQKGTVVFINNGIAKPVKPQDIVNVAGMFARDIEEGEMIKYNPLKNTGDIIVQGGLLS